MVEWNGAPRWSGTGPVGKTKEVAALGRSDRGYEAAAATDATIVLDHLATEARTTTSGVEVVMLDGDGASTTLSADYGICTIAPHAAARLTTNWDPVLVRALEQTIPVTTGKIGLEYGERFWERKGILGGISLANDAIRTIWYPSTDYLSEGGVVVGAYPFGPAAANFSRLDHRGRVDLASPMALQSMANSIGTSLSHRCLGESFNNVGDLVYHFAGNHFVREFKQHQPTLAVKRQNQRS